MNIQTHSFDCKCQECRDEDTQLSRMLNLNFYWDGSCWVGKGK